MTATETPAAIAGIETLCSAAVCFEGRKVGVGAGVATIEAGMYAIGVIVVVERAEVEWKEVEVGKAVKKKSVVVIFRPVT